MYGVENFNQEILNDLSKGIKLEDIRKVIKLTRKIGIVCRVSIMKGIFMILGKLTKQY